MFRSPGWPLAAALICTCCAARAQVWSEKDLIDKFESQSPQARQLRAEVATVEADARTRTVYPNPAFTMSREGAGYAAFFQGSQTLPISGRLKYLRDAGASATASADADREAAMWSLRNDLRVAFFRLVAAQERIQAISTSLDELERLISILTTREQEGEGSRFDRLRAEKDRTELRADGAVARALAAAAAGQVAGFLPEGSVVEDAVGSLDVSLEQPSVEELVQRASAARPEFRAARQELARYRSEELAARRLRVPEPTIAAGIKRGNVVSGVQPNPFGDVTRTGFAISVTVPLPVFNKGQYEVALYRARQEQAQARVAAVARQVRVEIEGAYRVLAVRRDALTAYQQELTSSGADLARIAQVSYDEGEVGILELLDSQRLTRMSSLRLLDLRAGVKEAWIELERAVGEEVRP